MYSGSSGYVIRMGPCVVGVLQADFLLIHYLFSFSFPKKRHAKLSGSSEKVLDKSKNKRQSLRFHFLVAALEDHS